MFSTNMGPTQPKRVTSILGNVTQNTYGAGSKSEREAVFIDTSDGRYILRRKNGPAFGDIELEEYIGHKVECQGFLVSNTLLAEQIKVIE
jgi:hypothetical protein